MDEAKHAELLRRVRAHPAFHGGPSDEGYWLDLMELYLADFGTYEFKVEFLADNLERHPERVRAYVAASERDRLFWDVLNRLVPQLWRNEKDVPVEFLKWWMDATTGVSDKPSRSGEHGRRNQMRDLTIVWAVNGIRDVTDLPYDFDEPSEPGRLPRSACHVVAGRLGWTYGKVRSIWRKNRSIVDRTREHGLVPPARARTRRTR